MPIYYNTYDRVEVGYKPHSPQTGLQEVDAIGTGCFLVSRSVMETIKAPFATIWDEDGIRHIGGDLAFCQRAKAAGFRIWAHYDYPCTHWKEMELTATAEAFLSYKRSTP